MKTKIRKKRFTLIEMMMVVAITVILMGILMPSLHEARQRAKFTRWFAYNQLWNRDADCVINYNFQDGSGNTLKNGAEACDWNDPNTRNVIDVRKFDGVLMSTTGGTNHNFEWISGGRWGKYKKALQFNGVDTYVDVPCRYALDFRPDQSFTVMAWAKFDKFQLGDGLYSKSGWGTLTDASAQYDLYCDPTAGSSGQGAFEVDVFTSCVGWNTTDVDFEKQGWSQVVLRYIAPTVAGEDGTIDCFVNGEPLGASRETNNAVATQSQSDANCILGAIGAKAQYWGKPIIFPFQGKMDEFMLFKRALTNAEIRGEYQMGKE